ncbi:MAG: rhomboid family intramembrane serine protease [Bacteroidota bacterium]
MKNVKLKLTKIYFPFLLITVGTIVFYTFLRWFFTIYMGYDVLKDEILNIWIPFALPWLPILFFLRRPLRILSIRRKRDNGHFLYQFFMVGVISLPMIIFQHYIEQAAYDLISVTSAEEVVNFQKEKFFKIEQFELDKSSVLSYATSRTKGKHNDKLSFYLYMALPFQKSNLVWYGVDFIETIDNDLSSEEKNTLWYKFQQSSKKSFQELDFQQVTYFKKLSFSDERDGYFNAITKRNPTLPEKDIIVLVPEKDRFEERLGNYLKWMLRSFGVGLFIFLLMVLIPKIDKRELKNFNNNQPIKDDDLQWLQDFLNPNGETKATAFLVILNLLVFLWMIIKGINIVSPSATELLAFGGNKRTEVWNGEYWRLLTSVFIHGGIMHLAYNLFAIGICGSVLEGILSPFRLIFIFLLCGIVASFASIAMNENLVSVGASGAIFGFYGVMIIFNVFKIYPVQDRSIIWIIVGLFGGVSLCFGFISNGIDNAAHIGGLLSGLLIGIVLIKFYKKELVQE